MAYKINITEHAEHDLDSALSYISYELSSPEAALSLFDSYTHAISSIESHPFGNRVDALTSDRTGIEIRKLRVGSYGIFYSTDDQTKNITVIAFLHSKRDAGVVIANRV